MARRTKEDAEKTRSAILMAALELLSQKGLASTSLDQIAQQAGVTRGAIYWHFKNKTELFATLLEEWLTPTHQLKEQWLVQSPPSLNHLKKYMTLWLSQIEQQDELKKLFEILFFKVELVGEVKTLIDQANEQADQDTLALQFYLGALKTQEELHPNTDVALLGIGVSSFLMGLAQNWLARPERFSLQEKAPLLVEQFFKGHLPQ